MLITVSLQHLSNTVTLSKALKEINRSPELNYLTQIIFMLFEDTSKDLRAEDRFRVDIHFSPGVKFRHAVFDEEDGISPTNSFANMPIKGSPDFSKFFVKRLPQSGHPKSEHLVMAGNCASNGVRKPSHGIVKTCVYNDGLAENEQSRRSSAGLIKSSHEPLIRIKKPLVSDSVERPSFELSAALKQKNSSKPAHPSPVRTTACASILKHSTEETVAPLVDPNHSPAKHFKPIEWSGGGGGSEQSPLSVVNLPPREQTDKQVSFVEPPPGQRREFTAHLLQGNSADTSRHENAFPSCFDDIHGAFESKSVQRRYSETSRSSDNTIPSHQSDDTVETPTNIEKHVIRKRSFPSLSSHSDSSILDRKHQFSLSSTAESMSFHESTEASPNMSRHSSIAAIHGSIERLEILETLEPLRREPVQLNNNLEWYGEKGVYVYVHCVCRDPSLVHNNTLELTYVASVASSQAPPPPHKHTHTAPGLVLAAELASTIEPLTQVCSAPLHQINDFFTSLTKVHLNFDLIKPEEEEVPKHRSRSTTPISILGAGGARTYRRSMTEKTLSSFATPATGTSKSGRMSISDDLISPILRQATSAESLVTVLNEPTKASKELAFGNAKLISKSEV